MLSARKHRIERALALGAICDARQPAEVGEQRPEDQRRLAALGTQAGQDAQRALRLAEKCGRRQFEHVVTRAVGNELGDLVGGRRRARHQQRDALDGLLRGEQVPLDPVGEKLRRCSLDRDALAPEALADPARQCAALDRLGHHEHAVFLEGLDPRSRERLALDFAGHQQHRILGRLLREAGQRATRLGIGRRADAQLDQPTRCKQRQVRGVGEQRVPVETALEEMNLPVGGRLRAHRGADRVAGFGDQQGLGAGDQVSIAQAAGKARREGVRRNPHCARKLGAGARGRSDTGV